MLNEIGLWLFDPSGLTPHGFCLLWEPGLIWTHAVSDTAIGLAYFTIPVGILAFARRRRDLVFKPVFWLFATFIMLCGATHWLALLTLWVPAYGIEGVFKAVTACVSVVTAIALWLLLPRALALPSPAQLRQADLALRETEGLLHQAQKMEMVGQLAGGIAHDFNNVLQGVLINLELARISVDEGTRDDAIHSVATACRLVDRAAALTSRLLVFARRQVLLPRVVQPAPLLREMEELIRRTLGAAIDTQVSPMQGDWCVLCDPNQLENALLNLAINARDAMTDGGTLTLATSNATLSAADLSDGDDVRPGEFVRIAVTDTGVGMTAELLTHVFEPFFTTKPIGQGSGLGLSQIYGFVRQSGGLIKIDSMPGQGTTVALFLPRHRQVGPVVVAAPEDCTAGLPALNTTAAHLGTVLLVEDEEGVRTPLVRALRRVGCVVLEAADGAGGLEIVRSDVRIDMLITDVGLPGMNGRQLADAARALRPSLRILLVTGDPGSAFGVSPPDDMTIMLKPFLLQALVKHVRQGLQSSAC